MVDYSHWQHISFHIQNSKRIYQFLAFKPQQTRFEGGAHFQNRKDDGVGNGRNRYTTNIASEQVEPQVKSSQRHLFKHDKDIYIYMYTAVQYWCGQCFHNIMRM